MITPFQSIFFLNENILAWSGYFGLFNKIRKGSGISIWCIFSAWFLHKVVPYVIFYQLTMFQCNTFFPFQDMKQNVLLSSYLGNWRRHKLKDLSSIILWSNDRQRNKEGKTKTQKFEYLENKMSFLIEIKSIPHN